MLQVKEMKLLVHSAQDSMSVHKVCGVCIQAWLSELSRSQAVAASAAWSQTHRCTSSPPIATHSASAQAVGSKPHAEAAAQVAAPAAANIAATTASVLVNDAVREVSCEPARALSSARADSPATAPATAAPAASAPAPSASNASIALACLGSAAAHNVLVSSSEPLSGPNPVPELSALPGPLAHLRPEVHSSNAQRAADAITASQTANAVPVSTAKESQPQEESLYPLGTSQQQLQPQPQQQVSTTPKALLNTTAIACGPSRPAEGQDDGKGGAQAQQTAASTCSEGSGDAGEGGLYPFPTHRSPQDRLAGIASSSPCAEEDSSHQYVFGRRKRTSADQNMPGPSAQAVPVPDLSKPTDKIFPGTLMPSLHSQVVCTGSRAAVNDSQAASLHDPAESPDVHAAPSGCQPASNHMQRSIGDSAAVMEAAIDTSGHSLAPQAATGKASEQPGAAPAGTILASAGASELDATATPVASTAAAAAAESLCAEEEKPLAAVSASASQAATAADTGPPAAALAAATEAAPVISLSSASAAIVDDPASMTPTLPRITQPSLPKKRKKSKYFSETFEVKKRRRNKTQRTKAENRAARAAGVALPSRASAESIWVHSSSWSGDSVSHTPASAQKHTGDSSRPVS